MSAKNHRPVSAKIAGLVLAGGEGRRMGGNKPFRAFGDTTLIAHVIDVARSQCSHVMISSNAGADAFGDYDVPVVADVPEPGQGPLGGVMAGLNALPNGIEWLMTFPVDCPVVPLDMVGRLLTVAEGVGAKAAYASHADRDHYLSSIWHRDATKVIADFLANDNRRVRGPLQALDAPRVVFEDRVAGLEPFTNVNTPDDLKLINRAFAGALTGQG
ncbi:molybdenum cofactor guanylyltransferase MobA [Thalassospira australica]|uniref:molybdenum cofactor guanylyltransferase MobA n=1 Tax=Thalassospira australica TaxID=1528106 RepID=UPI00051A2FC7|nr:molybdenum cofactor guanylyltransferase MobA [Thalassospira australica]